VDDELSVSGPNCLHNLLKQIEARAGRKPLGLRVINDWGPLNMLHHQVRAPAVRHTPIVEPRNVWVIETRQHLTLGLKPPGGVLRVETALQELDGHGLLEGAPGPLRPVDHAGPPDPNLLH
jgi:hypothetical protein